MATRSSSTKSSDPIRDIALELTKSALAAGALQRNQRLIEAPAQQARADATYVTTLFSSIEARLRSTPPAAAFAPAGDTQT